MAVTLVQSGIKTETGVTSSALAYTSNVASGNLLIVTVSCYHFLGPTLSISDSVGFTWAALPTLPQQELASGDVIHYAWSAVTTSAAACTVTITSDRSSSEFCFVITEWTGVDTSNRFTTNAIQGISTGGSTTPATGTIDPSVDPGVLFASCTHSNGNTSFTQDGAWTLLHEREDGSTAPVINTAYRTLTSGTTTASWTLGASAPWACYGIGMRESAGAAATSILPKSRNRTMRQLLVH
jgi:hypothetical protein